MSQDAYQYWQNKGMGSSAKKGKADGSEDQEELDEEFSASGSEVKFSDPDDEADDAYSMDNSDFAISASFKQAQFAGDRSLSTSKKSAGGKITAQEGRERLAKIQEEESKKARDSKLKEIMKQQKAQLGGGSDDDDSDFD